MPSIQSKNEIKSKTTRMNGMRIELPEFVNIITVIKGIKQWKYFNNDKFECTWMIDEL